MRITEREEAKTYLAELIKYAQLCSDQACNQYVYSVRSGAPDDVNEEHWRISREVRGALYRLQDLQDSFYDWSLVQKVV